MSMRIFEIREEFSEPAQSSRKRAVSSSQEGDSSSTDPLLNSTASKRVGDGNVTEETDAQFEMADYTVANYVSL